MNQRAMDELTKALDLWASRFLSGGNTTYVPQVVVEKFLDTLSQAKARIQGDIDPILGRLFILAKEEEGIEVELDNDLNRKVLTLMMANRSSMSELGQSLLDQVCGRFRAS